MFASEFIQFLKLIQAPVIMLTKQITVYKWLNVASTCEGLTLTCDCFQIEIIHES